MIDCREATGLALAEMDRCIGPWARLRLWLHRLVCAPCRYYRRQLAALRQCAGTLADGGDRPPQLSAAARARLRERLRDPPP
jgi:hypothetical protein